MNERYDNTEIKRQKAGYREQRWIIIRGRIGSRTRGEARVIERLWFGGPKNHEAVLSHSTGQSTASSRAILVGELTTPTIELETDTVKLRGGL